MMSALAAFLSSGVSFSEALERMRTSADDYMRWQIKSIERGMRSGKRPDQALLGLSMMHPSYHWIIAVYGMLSATKSASAYERISSVMMAKTIKKMEVVFGSMLSNIILAAIAAGIFWMYSSMFSIAQSGAPGM